VAQVIRIDGYTDLHPIGHGGLGDVYRATQTSTGATVAIKVLRDVSDQSVAWHRTRRELTALVALAGHANVVQLVELLDLADGPALVMEFTPGGSVASRLRGSRDQLSVAETVFVGRQTAAALVAAHALGIVHRDVKPQNLLIDAYGQVKLCDFGVAALLRSDDFHTRTSALSMRYASPEDLDEEIAVGPASDVFSLGATLVHLAHGSPLTLKERLAPWVPPPTDDPELVELDELIAACLHADARDRPTASELLDGLEQLDLTLAERCRALTLDVGSDHEPGPALAPAIPTPTGRAPTPTAVDRDRDPNGGVPLPSGLDPDPELMTARRAVTSPPPRPAPAPPRHHWVFVAAIALAIGAAALLAFDLWPRGRGPELVGAADDRASGTDVTPTQPTAPSTPSSTPSTPSTPSTAIDQPATTAVPIAEISFESRPDGLVAIDDPSVLWPFGERGECLVQIADGDRLQPIDCGRPHDLQRFLVADLDAATFPDAAPYDGAAIRDTVDDACRAAFRGFVGIDADDSVFDTPFTEPSEATWGQGDRRYQCLLGVPDRRTIGDAAGSSR
jgi:serine/threonine protein kinase